jgi:hypothetical protein
MRVSAIFCLKQQFHLSGTDSAPANLTACCLYCCMPNLPAGTAYCGIHLEGQPIFCNNSGQLDDFFLYGKLAEAVQTPTKLRHFR